MRLVMILCELIVESVLNLVNYKEIVKYLDIYIYTNFSNTQMWTHFLRRRNKLPECELLRYNISRQLLLTIFSLNKEAYH